MALPRALLALGLVLAAFECALAISQAHIGYHQDVSSMQSGLATKARMLLAPSAVVDEDNCCYKGCFDAPIDAPRARPLPTLLLNGTGLITLRDCFNATVAAHLSHFAIMNGTKCYGGDEMAVGWAPDDCPLTCGPDDPFVCGAADKASIFSVGLCLHLNVTCPGENSSPPPSPPPVAGPRSPSPRPPSPSLTPQFPSAPSHGNEPSEPEEFPPSPSPPPFIARPLPPPSPAVKKLYSCKDDRALWGVNLVNTPIKLNNKASTATNLAACEALCDARPDCHGFYYKTTTWCYLQGEVFAFGKKYSTAVKACKVIAL